MASQPSGGALSKANRRAQWQQDPLQYGEAISVTCLLSDWDKFGLSERVCYHFDLIETLTASTASGQGSSVNEAEYARRVNERNVSPSEDGVCGVASLLECIPKSVKYKRRDVRNAILRFNMLAHQVRQEANVACFEPSHLPLRLSPATRVSFAYEVTKMAFCLDASSTLVTTFGNGLGLEDEPCCALDRLGQMTSAFFKSLVKPITAPWLADPKGWRPILAVTVLAVYPNAMGASDTSILVRDFRVHDVESAERLSREIAQWALKEVESEIAHQMGHTRSGGIDAWNRPTPSSSLRDIFDAGDVALSLLPSHARPCIVLATDCRSVSCESILDLFQDSERVDTPLVVLDLSSSSSHAPEPKVAKMIHDKTVFLTYDPGSSSNFPLHLSDDSESLFEICQATDGAFFNEELLHIASQTVAGKVPEKSPIAADSYFAFRRRALRPNAVQWYTLFSLSPLTPCLHPSWGKLAPPTYLRERMRILSGKQDFAVKDTLSLEPRSLEVSKGNSFNLERRESTVIERTIFSIYVVSPVRVKGLLLMRVKEGYRAKQYGSSTQDPDKVSIQFKLPLEFGIVLHYELSYKALDSLNPLVGVANVKIELSGEKNFIQAVKNDFISRFTPVQNGRPSTIAMKASAKLCKVLRGMRREDCLQAYLCPLSWADKLSTVDSPFARRLGTLSHLQRRRHFRLDQFDVLCVGHMPYGEDEYLILSEFIDFDSGEQELFDALSKWSTAIIKDKQRYVKKTSSSRDDLIAYCVIEVTRSGSTSRIFTVTVETFGGSSAVDRLALLSSLKETISRCKDVLVLPKPMNDFLVGLRDPLSPELKILTKQRFLESHFHHESWSSPNPELLALLTKRRNEVGQFWFLHSSDTYSLFAKLVTDDHGKLVTADFTKASDSASSELYQVQYQIAVIAGSIVIDMHVEREQGVFFTHSSQKTRFHELFDRVRVRDQECGRALGSRTSLLSLLQDENSVGDQRDNVKRLLKYASRVSRKLRFFHSGAEVANKVLEELTVQLILSSSSRIQVRHLPLEASVGGVGEGIWFLIQFDGHTMGFVHLASSERQEKASDTQSSFMFRELTFFSIGISDLYCKRDLIAEDDDSADDHISEYMCVSEFADTIDSYHGKNYARAAYLALRMGGKGEMVSFDSFDFQYVLRHCSFSEFKKVTVVHDNSGGFGSLSRAITDVLSAVPGNKYCLYYSGDESQAPEDNDVLVAIDEDDESGDAMNPDEFNLSDDEIDASNHFLAEAPQEVASSHEFSLSSDDESETELSSFDIVPPIFVRLLVGDKPVSADEIDQMGDSVNVKAEISLLDQDGAVVESTMDSKFPEAHRVVILRVSALLDSYVAEQLLERFRHYGESISRSDLKNVKQSLRKARYVLTRNIPVKIYDSKSDSMVRPGASSGTDMEIEKAFPLLFSELQKGGSVKLSPTSATGFFVVDNDKNGTALKYWCFVTLNLHLGEVCVTLYHPEGEWKATEALSSVFDHVVRTMHRVNQMLLLQSLHRNRIASSYLIPGNGDFDEKISFGCPVKFKTSFALYDRCVASQVVLSLEASVLHSFAVSNRRGIFVYKDESDAIFYMKLNAVSGTNEDSDSVELLVCGLSDPGPSVTRQLNRLLQRKVHLVAVDALSAVLTKNPHLKWKSSDLRFLRQYDESYQPTDDEKRAMSGFEENVVEYAVPSYLYDPIMLLIYFRQNICGSTFFHRLHQANTETSAFNTSHKGNDGSLVSPSLSPEEIATSVPFDPREFVLFYNNAPSPLDPGFQPVCTLTTKGAEYARTAGTGIAIIEVTLIDCNGQTVQKLDVGQVPDEMQGLLEGDAATLRLQKFEKGGGVIPPYRIRVSIADTALNRTVLHSWVELTLNQVLIAWVVERHIQRTRLRKLEEGALDVGGDGIDRQNSSFSDAERNASIESMVPGFPRLFDILDTSHDLPHPAIEKLELGGVIRASSVATVALDLLEKCLNGLKEDTSYLGGDKNVTIVRLSRTQQPMPVDLTWDSGREKALATKLGSGLTSNVVLQDSPIDCPEYLCFYCFSHYSEDAEDESSLLSPSAMCFRKVMVDDSSDIRKGIPFIDALLSIRKSHPSAFSRSLVFVLSVKRNRRMLVTYNWNPQVVRTLANHLRDANTAQRNIAHKSVHSLQKRCLRVLSPAVTKHEPNSRRSTGADKPKPVRDDSVAKQEKVAKSAPSGKPPSRRIAQRPTSIRRPKLIGKSVEGAAVQAMAASRARASVTRGSSPFQKSSKSVPPARDTTVETGSKAHNTSSITRVASRDDEQHPSTESSQNERMLATELSILLKDYKEAMSLLSASPFHVSLVAQSLVDKFWVAKPERPLSHPVREFLLTRSVHLWSSSCMPYGFPDRMMHDVSSYFVQWLKMSRPEGFNVLQLDTPSRFLSILSTSAMVMVELKQIHHRTLCVVLRISLKCKSENEKPTLCCDAWMLLLKCVNKDVNAATPSRRKLRRKTTNRLEREATLVGKKVWGFAQTVSLQVQFLNFSSFLIEHSLIPRKESLSPAEMLSLLQNLIQKFPLERQLKMEGLQYSFFQIPIILASYENELIDLYDSNRLFDHLTSNAATHNMAVCNPDGLCFVNSIHVQETSTMCFLTRDPRIVGEMQLVLLTRREGRQMHEYVFRKGNPIGLRLADTIAIGGAAVARDELQRAAVSIRRDTLWSSFSSNTAKRSPSKDELQEFLHLVSSGPLTDVDPRLSSILFDRDGRYGLNWTECCKAMTSDSLFSPHWSFDDEKNKSTLHLFYMTAFDEFLSLSVKEDGTLSQGLLLWRDRKHENKESTIMAGQAFANYLLHYLWHNTL